MRGPLRTLAMALVGTVLTGCAASPWASSKSAAGVSSTASPQTTQPLASPASAPAAAGAQSTNPPTTPPSQPDPQALQQVIAEIQQSGSLDKATQERLLEDLKQTDPSLWPLVLQQFRAAVAYRRQTEQRELAAAAEGRDANGSPAASLAPSSPGSTPALAPGLAPPLRPGESPAQVASLPQQIDSPKQAGPTSAANARQLNSQREGQPPDRLGRLPGGDAALPPAGAPAVGNPSAPDVPPTARQANRPTEDRRDGDNQRTSAADGRVVSASYDPLMQGDWRAHLLAAIGQLESQATASPPTQEDVARLAQLRMLYLLADRRDAAMQPIPTLPPAAQEFWSKELYGLATWLDTQRNPDPVRRAAETKHILDEAVCRLGEAAPLVVRNLAFCTEIQSYGCAKPFSKYEFLPDQEVLLYVEVENFTSQATPKGFCTSLRSSYQIFDTRGQRVAEQEFAATEEQCQNPRRDFFIGYYLRMPKRIYPGKYTLQLTVEDLKSQKVGQSSIELTIKEEVERRTR